MDSVYYLKQADGRVLCEGSVAARREPLGAWAALLEKSGSSGKAGGLLCLAG